MLPSLCHIVMSFQVGHRAVFFWFLKCYRYVDHIFQKVILKGLTWIDQIQIDNC